MTKLENLTPERVFFYFEEITKIPHGSEDTKKIADFCVSFAKEHSLKFYRDSSDNIVIYKPASKGYENSEPIILQGHTDMVCQKTEDSSIDFLNDGLEIFVDGDFIKANKTTLGADNGIAVACIMAILENDSYSHPPIEAVFTTNEEIGMLGATALDASVLNGKRMINIDSEEDDVMTVSCAGGGDFSVSFPAERKTVSGTQVEIVLKGLLGGHSGIEIDKGRINANILAGRVLNHLKCTDFDLLSIDGGNKTNAITNLCKIRISSEDAKAFVNKAKEYLEIIKSEFIIRESSFVYEINILDTSEFNALSKKTRDGIIYALTCMPTGVLDMSAEIDNLVETSLNLGILETTEENVRMHISLRSNKETAMDALEEKLLAFFGILPCTTEISGRYPSWEFNNSSLLQKIYKDAYEKHFNKDLKTEAIHAGLECGVFASKIKDFDCISIGPDMFDVHTTKERLSISSTRELFNLLLKVLEKLQ
ncbi:MAG: aminoacyl-histidine dipeptidase [Clostridia bacterium]|nr:aminoacyl-histidine dipeptidase [Clostridia bacterium]